jgi:outer membrane biosynthesis protein TonB
VTASALLVAALLAMGLAAPYASADPALSVSPANPAPGGAITLTGTGFPEQCAVDMLTSIRLLWDDGSVLATVEGLGPNGSFTVGATIPASATPGPHTISSDCTASAADATPPVGISKLPLMIGYSEASTNVQSPAVEPKPPTPTPQPRPTASGTPETHSTTPPPTAHETKKTSVLGSHIIRPPVTVPAPQPVPNVAPQPQSREPEKEVLARSSIATSMRTPTKSAAKRGALALSAALAAGLVLILAFPSELFNSTLEDNYAEITAWFAGLAASTAGLRRRLRASPKFGVAAYGILCGVLLSFLDPTLGFNRSSLAFIAGLVTAVFVITFTGELSQMFYVHRLGRHGFLKTFPPATILAGLCVAFSRLLRFAPGYAFGLTAGYASEEELDARTTGIATAIGVGSILGLSVGAWFAWGPIAAAASKPTAGFAMLFLDALFSGVVLCGFGGLIFTLLPLRYCDGSKIKAWSRTVWVALLAISLFWFAHVIATPATSGTADAGSVAKAVALFLAFGLASVAFWAYFRFRTSHRAVALGEGPAIVVIDLHEEPAAFIALDEDEDDLSTVIPLWGGEPPPLQGTDPSVSGPAPS